MVTVTATGCQLWPLGGKYYVCIANNFVVCLINMHIGYYVVHINFSLLFLCPIQLFLISHAVAGTKRNRNQQAIFS